MIAQKYLDEYAYLDGQAYLDCATMGLPPARSLKLSREYLDGFARNLGKARTDHRSLCRERLARLINADPADICFTANTTQGNNLLTQGYPFQPGDEVILSNGDFPAVWMPWARKQRDGVRLVIVPHKNGAADVEDFIARITPRTKAIAISWVQSNSGYVADLARLGKVCRERGILLCVDGIQGLGRIPMDVQAMNIDLLASGSFKGLLGVMGAGFCYCRREIMDQITPPVCSGNVRWQGDFFDHSFTSLAVPEFESGAMARMETGTMNVQGIAVMGESLGLLLEIGVENIQRRVRELELYYRRRLAQSGLKLHLLGSEDPETWSGTVSFSLPEGCAERLAAALEGRKISLSMHGECRVSFHYYNSEAQIDRLMEALQEGLA